MVSQKQMCAKRKTVIYLKFYFHAPIANFLRKNRIDGSKRTKLPEKMAAVKGNLISSILTSYIAKLTFYSLCTNLPLHQPAPVSPKRRIEYFKYRFFASLDEINTCHIHSKNVNTGELKMYVPIIRQQIISLSTYV